MEEVLEQIKAVLHGLWRRRWTAMLVAWGVAALGTALVLRMDDRYEVSARVFVDTQTVLKPLLSGLAVQPDVDQQVSMLARTLITRPNLEALLDQAGSELGVQPKQRESFIDLLENNIRIAPVSGRNLFKISYIDSDSDRGMKVVHHLVELFMQSGHGDHKRDADEASRIINDQIKAYELRLAEAENKLKEFKIKNAAYIGSNNLDYFQRTRAAAEEVAQLESELRAAEQSRDAMRRELMGEDPVLLPMGQTDLSGLTPELDGRIDAARRQLDELERRFTRRHPDVVATRALIRRLEAQRRSDIEARRKALGGVSMSTANNPVFQRLKLSLAEAEAQVASLGSKLIDARARQEQLRAASDQVPQIEAEMAQLNRDYDIVRSQYQALVGRRETANISGNVDATGRLAQFRLVEPPRASTRPVFPNRSSLLVLALMAALGAGGAVAFGLTQMNPVVYGLRQLRALTQRPVLGRITMLSTPERQRIRLRDDIAFAGAASALALSWALCLVWVSIQARL